MNQKHKTMKNSNVLLINRCFGLRIIMTLIGILSFIFLIWICICGMVIVFEGAQSTEEIRSVYFIIIKHPYLLLIPLSFTVYAIWELHKFESKMSRR